MTLQTSPDTFWHWLYTNAPAAWASALLATITCVLLVRTRKKPKRLVIRESRNTSLVSIWPSVRDKIKMTFDDKPIKTVGQIDADVFNEGSEVIQRPTFEIALSEKSVVLDVLVTPQDLGAESKIDRNTIAITLPYLNPAREHRQIVKLSLLVDGETDKIKVVGGGEGWSVRHLPLTYAKQELFWGLSSVMSLLLGIPLTSWYGQYIGRSFGVPPDEVSWRAFVTSLPAILLLLLAFALPFARFWWLSSGRFRQR